MRIGVYGSAGDALTETVAVRAKLLGTTIAQRGHVLVTGACRGYPYDAAIGAKEAGGRVVGYSPAINMQDHTSRYGFPIDGFDEFVFMPENFHHRDNKHNSLKSRNIDCTNSVDAGVIVGGQTGTLNEFTLLYDRGQNIGILEGSGGISNILGEVIKILTKKRGSTIVFEEDPAKLIIRLEELYQLNSNPLL